MHVKQFISIVLNLLDALKTSFSHRSLSARSIGKRDTVSEAAVASISMLKVIKFGFINLFYFLQLLGELKSIKWRQIRTKNVDQIKK